MAITANVSETTARNYFHRDPERMKKVGDDVWKLLNTVAGRLGAQAREVPPRLQQRRPRTRGWRIALVTELEQLHRAHTPVVLIHANLLEYEQPVIANVARCQDTLEEKIRTWVQTHVTREKRNPTVVLVTAPEEAEHAPYPVIDRDAGASMRNRRTRLFRNSLASMPSIKARFVEVEDYSSSRATEVYRQVPDADAYICLSDQIAVALKHLREAGGNPLDGAIVGFDNADLARSERISSFDQELERTARLAIEALAGFFSRPTVDWPQFETQYTNLALDRRDGSRHHGNVHRRDLTGAARIPTIARPADPRPATERVP